MYNIRLNACSLSDRSQKQLEWLTKRCTKSSISRWVQEEQACERLRSAFRARMCVHTLPSLCPWRPSWAGVARRWAAGLPGVRLCAFPASLECPRWASAWPVPRTPQEAVPGARVEALDCPPCAVSHMTVFNRWVLSFLFKVTAMFPFKWNI